MPKSKKNPVRLLQSSLSIDQFLDRYWQKKPLLLRNAFPNFKQLVTREALFELASRDDTESRLIWRRGNAWQVQHGPLAAPDIRKLPKKNWTLLVQDVQHHIDAAWQVLSQFAFISYARLDDLMVSYAADGGGVGPHYDSYDVFLIQSLGRRRWRIAKEFDPATRSDTPLKILTSFTAENEWLLEPGDLLYLPPDYAHEGIADGECMTLSVGFRAPRQYELALAYLQELAAQHNFGRLLCDKDLAATEQPAKLDRPLIARYRQLLEGVDWQQREFAQFLGIYLSEPKPHTEFEPPHRPLNAATFARRVAAGGIRLDGKTRMLYFGAQFFINGEHATIAAGDRPPFARLADRRHSDVSRCSASAMTMLYDWYRAGFIKLVDHP